MKRSKRLLSLLLAVMVLLTTVVSATMVSTSAAGTLASYYKTNPNGQVGVKKTISVDDSISDWDSSMLIAQGTANDDPRVYRPNSMYEIPHDTYALYGAYDDNNIYLMWEMTNVQDVVAPWDTYPLSQGVMYQTMNIPFFIAIDTGKSDVVGNNGALTTGGTIWDSGITISTSFNRLIAISTNGANGPFLYSGDSTGLNPVEIAARAETGIQFGYGLGILSENIYGIDGGNGLDHNRVLGDMCNEDAAWVDFNTKGHSSSTMDFHYEMAIPYKALGITAADVEANGVGALVIITSGKSGMDCLPYDLSMNDQADLDDSAGSQENNSFEKSDEDNITCAFARIGKLGSGSVTPVPTPTTAPAEDPTTAEPTQATTAAPVVTPTTAEPTEIPTTNGDTAVKPSVPVVIPPVVEPSETTPTEVPTTVTNPIIPVPTLDFDDPTETTPVATTETKSTDPIVVPSAGILGDADGDGKVSIKDATLIQKHIAKITILDENAQFLSDVDANEIINIRDVTNIQKWLAKIDVEYAIGESVSSGEIVVTIPTTKATEVATTTAPVIVPIVTTAPVESTTAEPTEVPTTAEPVPTETQPIVTEPAPVPTETQPQYTEPQYTEPQYTEPDYPDYPDYPDNPDVGTITIYFENTYGWSSVYWHAWNDAGGTNTPWPGDPMTNVSGNIYSAEVSTEFTGIIFNDGSGSDSAKTDNADIAGDGQMYSNGSWVAYDPNYNGGGDDPYNPPSGEGRTVYFSNVNHWDAVYAYVWNDAGGQNAEWPGEMMTLVEEDNGYGQQVYSFTVSAEYNYIIFSNGNGTQCADINLNNEVNNGFYLTGEVINDKGHYGYESYAR